MKKGIVFDFDYTLGDSTEGIVLSVNEALEQLGYERKSVEEIKQTVGLSLEKTYQALTRKNNSEEAALFSKLFRNKADEVMVANTRLYDGILDILKKLKKNGLQIGIVTTKFHYRIDQILVKFDAVDLIDFIVGAEDVQKAKPSPEGLLHMVKLMCLNPEDILYVGDSVVDAQTAERAGIAFAGVLTGTTARREFRTYHCASIGETIQEIYAYVMQLSLEELIQKMNLDEDRLISSDDSVSWQAHREAEGLADPEYLPLLKEMIQSHQKKKDQKYRDSAYFILGKLLAKEPSTEMISFFIEQLEWEDNRHVLGAMLDRICDLEIPASVSIQPILQCARHDQWQVRHAAIPALAASHTEESREMLRYYIAQTDEKTYGDEIIYAQAALGKIGTQEDLAVLEQHRRSRRRDIKMSAEYAIGSIQKRLT